MSERESEREGQDQAAVLALRVSHQHRDYSLQLPASATVAELQTQLAQLTDVPPSGQKLLGKHWPRDVNPGQTLAELNLPAKVNLMMIGATQQETDAVLSAEAREKRRSAARAVTQKHIQREQQRERSAKESSPYRFHRLEVLQQRHSVPGVPGPEEAMAYMERLSTDPGIRSIMENHQWGVGLLKEFAPSLETGLVGVTEGCLLGYNRNKGEEIALRLRTDDFEGFRHYSIVIKTLLHELAHMVHSDHDRHFHALNRQLNEEYKQLNWKKLPGHLPKGGMGVPGEDFEFSDEPFYGGTGPEGRVLSDAPADHPRGSARDLAADAAARRAATFLGQRVAESAPNSQTPATTAATAATVTSAATASDSSATATDTRAASSDTATRRDRPIAVEGMDKEQSLAMSDEERMAAMNEAKRRAAVMQNAEEAYESSTMGQNPYVYRPRRGLRIGEDYQAVIPDLEAGAGATADAPKDSTTQHETGGAAPAAMEVDEDFSRLADAETQNKLHKLQQGADTLGHLLRSSDAEAARDCQSVLYRLLDRILQEPNNARLRRINTTSQGYAHNTRAAPQAAREFLLEIGFTPDSDNQHISLTRNDLALVAIGRDLCGRLLPG